MTYTSEFPIIGVTVDAIIFSSDLKSVLLVERGAEPYKGQFALPGGFLDISDASLAHAAARELLEETGLVVAPETLVCMSGRYAPGRDPRGPVVTNPFYHIMPENSDTSVLGADDATSANWEDVFRLLGHEMAFDHKEMLGEAVGLATKSRRGERVNWLDY